MTPRRSGQSSGTRVKGGGRHPQLHACGGAKAREVATLAALAAAETPSPRQRRVEAQIGRAKPLLQTAHQSSAVRSAYEASGGSPFTALSTLAVPLVAFEAAEASSLLLAPLSALAGRASSCTMAKEKRLPFGRLPLDCCCCGCRWAPAIQARANRLDAQPVFVGLGLHAHTQCRLQPSVPPAEPLRGRDSSNVSLSIRFISLASYSAYWSIGSFMHSVRGPSMSLTCRTVAEKQIFVGIGWFGSDAIVRLNAFKASRPRNPGRPTRRPQSWAGRAYRLSWKLVHAYVYGFSRHHSESQWLGIRRCAQQKHTDDVSAHSRRPSAHRRGR